MWTDEQDSIHKFQVAGHAGYADEGKDIICAGVSAVAITAVNGLAHFLSKPPLVEERDGFLSCELQALAPEELTSAQWILKTMVLGFESIREAYGSRYLTIDWRRWTPC